MDDLKHRKSVSELTRAMNASGVTTHSNDV